MESNAYRWKVTKLVRPGESEPVIQMHLVPSEEEEGRQRLEQERYMHELKATGYIKLPLALAEETGILKWNPRDKEQTERVLVAMSNDGSYPGQS